MKYLLKILMIGLIYFCINPSLKAQDTLQPWLKLQQTIDLCGSQSYEKEVLFTLELGQIKVADSLFGLNFELRYDPGVAEFIAFGTINTMYELFEWKDVTHSVSDSAIRGSVLIVNTAKPPMASSRPFIAVSMRFKGDCTDTAKFSISYIEFTDEFKKKINSYKGLDVVGEIKNKPDRLIKVYQNIDTLKFDTDTTNLTRSLNYSLEANDATNGKITITDFNTNYVIDSIRSNDVSLSLSNFVQNDESSYSFEYDIKAKMKNQNAISLFVREQVKDSLVFTYSIKNEILKECSCVLNTDSKSAYIAAYKKSKVDDTTSVNTWDDEQEFTAILADENIRLTSKNRIFKKIRIVNLLGEEVFALNAANSKEITIEKALSKGLYLLIIEDISRKIYTIKMAK